MNVEPIISKNAKRSEASEDCGAKSGGEAPVPQLELPVLSGEAISGATLPCARPARKSTRFLIPFAVLCTFAVFFVGWDIFESSLFPTMSTGVRHALLTMRAALVTAAASLVVYLLMRRQQRRLSGTAEELAGLLEAYKADSNVHRRFENASLLHCRDVLGCKRTECPMYNGAGRRCWQAVALRQTERWEGAPPIDIQRCHECDVYKRSCPDALTKLGESFNNLMFLLAEEARQVGLYRALAVEKEKMIAIGHMATGVAHEVGNPLSSISSIVQMMRRRGERDGDNEQLELIETHIQRISTTVRQLASLAKPAPERWELTDISETLQEAVGLIAFDRRARGVKIDFEPSRSLPKTFVLRAQLQQVFINLSLNAFDAMEDGGELAIRTRCDNGKIAVTFEDSGCGIPAETGRRVFEPFFTTKEPGRGTGLGLSISYGIVQKHGGTIGLRSAAGKGTAFTVELPVLATNPDA